MMVKSAFDLVLNGLVETINMIEPILIEFKIIEIGFAVLFVTCGLRLLIPILGHEYTFTIRTTERRLDYVRYDNSRGLEDKGGK